MPATWIGTAPSSNIANYNSASNWTGGDTPDAPGETAVFGATGAQIISVNTAINPDSWIFGSTAQPFSIGGTTVTLNAGLTVDAAAGVAIFNSIAGPGSVQVNGGTTVTLNAGLTVDAAAGVAIFN